MGHFGCLFFIRLNLRRIWPATSMEETQSSPSAWVAWRSPAAKRAPSVKTGR